MYVAGMQDSFPHALELSEKGYNAFALIYRPGAQTACEDLSRAIAFISDHAEELQVDPDDYSLWGGSAGARMAAWVGTYGTSAFGEKEYPAPAAVIMQYTGLSEVTGEEPPTYACVGTSDGIASYRTMSARINRIKANGTNAEIEIFKGLSHGFGLGEGTVAEGYRLIDTANAYMNEKAVGRAIKKSGVPREDIFLETKLWPSFYENEDAVEKTLERLDTDYIDLLLIHQPAGNYIAGYRLMEKAYKEGKVKAIGLSNFTKEGVQEILDICEVKPTVLQTEVHPYDQKKELKEFLAKEGIKIQAWYPLGHGDADLMKEPAFVVDGSKYKKSTAQIILRWHIQDGNIVIPGSKNPEHIKANLDLFDFQLTEEEMKEIATLDKNETYYHQTPELLKKYVEMVPPVDEQK